ncbi:hypothetical protein [Nocardia yamanashiensis]|uniref:hypothetical protein n=1 Tax=Nocardia yamanashiensis TaxID=209247 RepID=UPI00082E01FF|nr:hypothetical protein [Nocardia yamanashiensis]
MDHIIADVPALIAAVAQQFHNPIPARGLVLLLVKRASIPGHYVIEHGQSLEPDDPDDIVSVPYTDHERWTLTSSTEGMQIVAIIIDAEANGVGDNASEHNQLIDKVALVLEETGHYIDSAYATRATTAGSPVWCIDRDSHLGTVPEPVEIAKDATAILPESVVSSDLL